MPLKSGGPCSATLERAFNVPSFLYFGSYCSFRGTERVSDVPDKVNIAFR